MRRTAVSILVGLTAFFTLAGQAQAQCYIAYVHGKGDDLSPGVVDDTARANYWRRDASDTYGDFVRYSRGGCTTLITGYNGRASFWDPDSAGRVAQQINDFITQHNIQPGQLRIISHSMGGLVTRWILNNGSPGSPYYNFRGENYARIRTATSYFITVATPHLGSEAADAVYGSSDTLCGNFVGWVMGALGERNRATDYLRRINLEYASVPSGGWLGDSARTTRMYTIATRRQDGLGTTQDILLAGVWECLGNNDDTCWIWGEGCGDIDEPGDGLVSYDSGRGRYERSGSTSGLAWSSGTWVVGARTAWLDSDFNHHQVRLDAQQRRIENRTTGAASSYWMGSYIGSNGTQLPL